MSVLTEPQATPWATRPGWGIAVDLMPREVLDGRRTRSHRRLVVLGLVLVLLACGGLTLMSLADQSAAQRSADAAQSRTGDLRAAAAEYADITAATNSLRDTANQTSILMAEDVDVVNLVARFRNALPATVTISNLTVLLAPADPTAVTTAGDRAVIGTVTIAGGGDQIRDLAPFVAELNHLPGVVDVVPGSTIQTAEGMTYSLSLKVTDVLFTHRFDLEETP